MRFIYDNFSKKPYKPFYNAVVPRAYRKQWHYNYHEIPTQNEVAKFWDEAIVKYQNSELDHFNLIAQKPELIGKKLFGSFGHKGSTIYLKLCNYVLIQLIGLNKITK